MSNATQSGLVRIEPQAMEQHRASDDPQALIALAIEKGLDLKELVAMRREWRAEKAKEAFDAAMAAFQAECPIIYKTKAGATPTIKYAPFEDVLAQVKPFLQKHGFSFQLGTDVESKDGWVIAKCKVTHSQGHSDTTEAKFPLGNKTGVMSDTQVYASALSFASRRAFQNAFAIVTAGEDMDGRVKQKPKGPSSLENLAGELWDVLLPVRGKEKNAKAALAWLVNTGIIEQSEIQDPMRLPRLSGERYQQIIESAKAQLAKEAE